MSEPWEGSGTADTHSAVAAPSTVEDTNGTMEERWLRVQSKAQSYKHQKPEDEETQGDDLLWQSAMNRYTQDSVQNNPHQGWDAVAQVDDAYPPTLSQVQENQQHQRMQGEMDRIGTGSLQSMDYEEAALPRGDGEHTNESLDKLSLWQTFQVMYKRKPMCKYYILGLSILLAATAAIIGVSISKSNSSGSKDCDSASYNSEGPFLLLPEQSSSIRASGFGTSISASAEYLVVGAPNPACNPKVSSCDDFTIGGAAYMYRRNNNNVWAIYSSFILDDGISMGDKFGNSVAIDTDSTTVVIGAPQDDGLGIQAGAIYVIEKPFSSTTAPIRLVSSDIGVKDEFGGSVSVSVTTIGTISPIQVTNVVVGASLHDSVGSNSGAVYVFSKFDGEPPADACGGIPIEEGKWIQCQKLLPDDGETNDQFGKACDISGRTIVVGAMWDDDKGIDSGAAYVFSLGDNGQWSLQQKLLSTNFEARADRFGHSVSTSGNRIVVGADLDNSKGDDSGAGYVYKLSDGVWDFESKLVPSIDPGSMDARGYTCGFSVDISSNGLMVLVGCPEAPGGGITYMYNFQNEKWLLTEKLRMPNGYNGSGLQLGSSVAASSEEDGMAIVGYGEFNGEIFSYRKNC